MSCARVYVSYACYRFGLLVVYFAFRVSVFKRFTSATRDDNSSVHRRLCRSPRTNDFDGFSVITSDERWIWSLHTYFMNASRCGSSGCST